MNVHFPLFYDLKMNGGSKNLLYIFKWKLNTNLAISFALFQKLVSVLENSFLLLE